jgi:CRP/FNR family transcriptional regulator, cyclic AMP receptor protein
MSQVLEVIQKSSLFQNCSAPALEKLAAKSVLKELGPGQSLFFENENSKSFFLVRSGTITIKKTSEQGDVDIAKIGGGSTLGEMALLRDKNEPYPKRAATAEASEFTILVEIPYEDFEKSIASDPVFGSTFYRNLSAQLAARIRRTAQDFSSLKALRLRHL